MPYKISLNLQKILMNVAFFKLENLFCRSKGVSYASLILLFARCLERILFNSN